MTDLEREVLRLGLTPTNEGFCPASELDLQRHEHQVGVALPPEYRWFQLTYGMGYLDPPASIVLADGESAVVDYLGENLLMADIYLDPPYPPSLVPCASDLLADMFFLRMVGEQAGSVWWWCYYEGRGPETELVWAADDFTSFLHRLEPRDD